VYFLDLAPTSEPWWGGSAPRPLQGSVGANGSWNSFLSHFITLLHMHPPVDAGESLCVAFDACIHASKGAQVHHDQVGVIEFFFHSECIFGFCTN
jgi:hypothetical protein